MRHQREGKRRRRGPFAVAAALLAGLLISSLTAWDASQAAFSGNTSNPGSSWSTASVALTDNDGNNGTAMFSASGLTPNSSPVTSCIKVTYTGAAAAVKMYGSSGVSATGLAQYINLSIVKGTAGSNTFGDCTGFTADSSTPYSYTGTLAAFDTACYDAWATGCSVSWTPSASQSVWFQFTTSIANNNSAQGLTLSSVPFTWEAQG
jgi:hypothetical protein